MCALILGDEVDKLLAAVRATTEEASDHHVEQCSWMGGEHYQPSYAKLENSNWWQFYAENEKRVLAAAMTTNGREENMGILCDARHSLLVSLCALILSHSVPDARDGLLLLCSQLWWSVSFVDRRRRRRQEIRGEERRFEAEDSGEHSEGQRFPSRYDQLGPAT